MKVVVLTRGRITIPVDIRRKLGIMAGTRIIAESLDNERIILTPVTRGYIHALRGKYKGKGLMKAWMLEKKRDREW